MKAEAPKQDPAMGLETGLSMGGQMSNVLGMGGSVLYPCCAHCSRVGYSVKAILHSVGHTIQDGQGTPICPPALHNPSAVRPQMTCSFSF